MTIASFVANRALRRAERPVDITGQPARSTRPRRRALARWFTKNDAAAEAYWAVEHNQRSYRTGRDRSTDWQRPC